MLTRVFLAAGVAALAIAAPASAGPGGGHGGGGGGGNGRGNGNGGGGPPAAAAPQQGGGGNGGGGGQGRGNGGGGGGGGPRMEMPHGGGGGGGGGGPRFDRGGGGGGPRMEMRAPQQMQRVERQQMRGFERQQARQVERQQMRGIDRQQARQMERQQARGFERQQARQMERQQARGFERQQARQMERQQARGFDRQQARQMERQQARNIDRQQGDFGRQQARMMERQQAQAGRDLQQQQAAAMGQFKGDRLAARAFDAQQMGLVRDQQRAFQQQYDASRFAALNYGAGTSYFAPTVVQQFIGLPVQQVASFGNLSPFPASLGYLYPSTDDYYYQYGNGYAYQIDRGDNLIQALIPLLAGGYLPGSYLPASYMNSYVPDYYGYDAFYPDYNDVCNRYYDGVIYQVDCQDGYVENVIPMYSGGYGVGQMLPSAYNYYNVPTQYRSVYYDTADTGYWYSPGAIYQYDPNSRMITSVAALLSPGFSVGQPLPAGYGVYNVPYDYRSTYYDTPNAWYRYNNGYIYQVDPVTQVVQAIVASLLT